MLSDIFEDRIGRIGDFNQLTISRTEQIKALEQSVLLLIESIHLRLGNLGESLQNIVIEHDLAATLVTAMFKYLEMCHAISPGQEIRCRAQTV